MVACWSVGVGYILPEGSVGVVRKVRGGGERVGGLGGWGQGAVWGVEVLEHEVPCLAAFLLELAGWIGGRMVKGRMVWCLVGVTVLMYWVVGGGEGVGEVLDWSQHGGGKDDVVLGWCERV